MRIEQIEQVAEIAQTSSLSQAAKNLYISQPNLSISLKRLERELGMELFIRTGKGMILTDFGREFLAFSQPINLQFDILKERCRSLVDRTIMTFSISNMYFRFVTSIFYKIYNKYRSYDTNFTLRECSLENTIRNVREQNSDVGFIKLTSAQRRQYRQIFNASRLEYVKIYEDVPYIMISKNSKLNCSDVTSITAEALNGYSLICYESVYHGLSSELHALGLDKLPSRVIVDSRAAFTEILARADTFAISAMSRNSYLNTDYYPNVVYIPLADAGFTYEIGYLKRSHSHSSPLITEFIDMLNEVISE